MLATPTTLVAYLGLFALTGFLFVAVSLFIGRFLRAHAPTPEKLETYECGEPAIGSSFVQFDLRFYVVALVFIIFDVEVAFFFPWATVFGTAAALTSREVPRAVVATSSQTPGQRAVLSPVAREKLRDLGMGRPALPKPSASAAENDRLIAAHGQTLARAAMIDVAVFFGVLLVGFAYVWAMGDLDWVRATGRRQAFSEEWEEPAVEPPAESPSGSLPAAAATEP